MQGPPGAAGALDQAQHERAEDLLAQAFRVLRAPYLATTLKVALMVTGAQGGSYALSVWPPTFLKTERGLSSLNAGSYLLIHIFGAFLGFLVGAIWPTGSAASEPSSSRRSAL